MTGSRRPRRVSSAASPRSVWYLVGGAVLIGAYFLMALAHAPGVLQVLAYATIVLSGPVAVVAGVRRFRPGRGLPWFLLAAGQGLYGVGDVLFYLQSLVLGGGDQPVSDLCYLASYPLMAAGLLAFIRRRTPGGDPASVIDTVIVGLGAGLVMWIYLLAPHLADPTQSRPAAATTVLSGAMDLLVGTLAVRMALGHTRARAALRLLYVWAGGLFAADMAYGYLGLTGAYHPGDVLDLVWLVSALALGAAALHPSMRAVDEAAPVPEPTASLGRLSALALTCLSAPALLYLEDLRHARLHVPLIAAASAALFLLALARMKVLADAQRRTAITDPLTGLRTRRYLREAMLRHTRPGAGLLLIDLDHFKKVNDTYGHLAGDQVLVETARRLREAVRRGDVVARYGGEEFAVLLPRADAGEIAELAERIRRQVSATGVPAAGRLLPVTASIGAAAVRPGQSPDELIADADRALYDAKEAGRNRVVTAVPTAPAHPAPTPAALDPSTPAPAALAPSTPAPAALDHSTPAPAAGRREAVHGP